MARNPQPREVAELKGATKQNPQRYRNEVPKSDLPLGVAPEHMTDEARSAWFEIESYAIPGVLTAADRIYMEMIANLLADYREDPSNFPCNKIGQMVSILARFGMSPADRQKLNVAPEQKKSDFDDI